MYCTALHCTDYTVLSVLSIASSLLKPHLHPRRSSRHRQALHAAVCPQARAADTQQHHKVVPRRAPKAVLALEQHLREGGATGGATGGGLDGRGNGGGNGGVIKQ